MDYTSAFHISASGMAVEKARLDVAASNIANMHSAATNAAAAYRPLHVLAEPLPLTFSEQFGRLTTGGGGVRVAAVEPLPVAARLVYEPGHPYADGKGFVAYPGINHNAEMINLNTALRAYEANLAALGAAKSMASRTLDIGGKQ